MNRILLAPLSWMYGAVVAFRHLLYDEHFLPTYIPKIPTICVGNIAVGGTGKTPMVEHLIRVLRPHYRVAVLSRGYKRHTHGVAFANVHSTAVTIGDEPMQLHSKFPDITIVVAEKRVEAMKMLERMSDNRPEVVILDDAFQHRAIKCSINIILTAYDRLYTTDHLLPWGKLRDLHSRIRHAHIVVVTKCPDSIRAIDKRLVYKSLHLAAFQRLYFSHQQNELAFTGNPLVLTGIANPQYLLQSVQSIAPSAELMAFSDHHRFSRRDCEAILQRANHFDCVLTTDKDMTRLMLTTLPDLLGNKLQVVPLNITIDEDKLPFDECILNTIKEQLRKR